MTADRPTRRRPVDEWQSTACILCSINCGVEVKTDGRRITRVRGDKAHPGLAGYTCEKALRLDHYQNARDRLTSRCAAAPTARSSRSTGTPRSPRSRRGSRRSATSTAARRSSITAAAGRGTTSAAATAGRCAPRSAACTRRTRSRRRRPASSGSTVSSSAARGVTPRRDFEHAEVAVFVGKNPWQSHGFPRARVILKEIAKDPDRALIVIDPRRTETADLADFHLQVRPGTDAWCLGALLEVLVEEDLVDAAFLAEHANGLDELVGGARDRRRRAAGARSRGVDEDRRARRSRAGSPRRRASRSSRTSASSRRRTAR